MEVRPDQRHDQALRLLRMTVKTSQQGNQLRMIARLDPGRHFAVRQTIAGHCALEQLERHLAALTGGRTPVRLVDHSRSAMPKQGAQLQLAPLNSRQPLPLQHQLLLLRAEGVARIGQPGQTRQLSYPVRQRSQPIGGNAQQFECIQTSHALRQCRKLVAGQCQFLQVATVPQRFRQFGNPVVRQDQPAQLRRQCLRRHMGNPAGLEPDGGERLALPQYCGQGCERVVRTEHNAQPGKARQPVR